MKTNNRMIAAFVLTAVFCSATIHNSLPTELTESMSDTMILTSHAASAAGHTIAWQQGSASEAQRKQFFPNEESWYSRQWSAIDDKGQTIGSSACGILSYVNMAYYCTGNFINPATAADWALENGYRTRNNGVNPAFFRAFTEEYGKSYGIYYADAPSNVDEALAHVRNGGAVCGCVPGHWISIVGYSSETDSYLILDSNVTKNNINNGRRTSLTWEDYGVAYVDASVFKNPNHPYTLVGRCMRSFTLSQPVAGKSVIEKLIDNAKDLISDLLTPEQAQILQNPWNYTEPTRTLKMSDKYQGNDVQWLQAALSYAGYTTTIDGYFGKNTQKQVKQFQQDQGITVDGIVGTVTRSRLKQVIALKREGNSDGISNNTENYTPPANERILSYTPGKALMSGEDVKWVQSALNKVMGARLTVDGLYGKETMKAVKNFQNRSFIMIDGMVGPETREKLNKQLENPFGGFLICGGEAPCIAWLGLADENKSYFAEDEGIVFEFDSDTGDEYRLTIVNEYGNTVYDYVTKEFTHSVQLDAGSYTAFLTVSNDSGAVSAAPITFEVVVQAQISNHIAKICSAAYEISIAYDPETDQLYTTTEADYEAMWRFESLEDWRFTIYNAFCGRKLCVTEEGSLEMRAANDETELNDRDLWYLCKDNGMTFIKNAASDLTLTITSDGNVLLKELDTTTNAQDILLTVDDRMDLVPVIETIDASHAKLSWNPVEGADQYDIIVYEQSGLTEDGIFYYVQTADNNIVVDIPESGQYSVWMEASVGGDILIESSLDDNELTEPEASVTEPEPEESESSIYTDKITQLQNYLLNKGEYSTIDICDLDMNFDGVLDAFDLAILKRIAEE